MLADTPPDRTPARVRISLHGPQAGFTPQPGLVVMLTAHLSPPDGPVAPGGFDFQRLAWFSRLGAVGYTRAPVMVLERAPGGLSQTAFRLRMALSAAMQARMPGQAGAFAAALMTGDRSGVTSETNDILRASNLSHMISISGLHMGLLTGFVFALVRYGLALFPPLALRLDTREARRRGGAAGGDLLHDPRRPRRGDAAVLHHGGGDAAGCPVRQARHLIAHRRDRRADLSGAGARKPDRTGVPDVLRRDGGADRRVRALVAAAATCSALVLRPAAVMILSSLMAGTATAPIAAAHFNRIAEYGLLANLLAVPVMGMVVMPAGVVAAILAPVGLAGPALWAMEKGIGAHPLHRRIEVAALDGAIVTVPAPPAAVLPLLGAGGALLLMFRLAGGAGGRGAAGRIPCAVGGGRAAGAAGFRRRYARRADDRSGPGAVEARRAPVSSRKAGSRMTATLAAQPEAFARAGFDGPKGCAPRHVRRPRRSWSLPERAQPTRAAGACADGALVILSEDWAGPQGDCRIFDRRKLRSTGALAVYPAEGGPLIVGARAWAGERLWNTRPPRRSGDRTASAGQ